MMNMITGIISITIGAVILSSVFISTIKNTNQSAYCDFNTTGTGATECVSAWTTGEVAMWSLLSLLGIVGLLYGVLSIFGLV